MFVKELTTAISKDFILLLRKPEILLSTLLLATAISLANSLLLLQVGDVPLERVAGSLSLALLMSSVWLVSHLRSIDRDEEAGLMLAFLGVSPGNIFLARVIVTSLVLFLAWCWILVCHIMFWRVDLPIEGVLCGAISGIAFTSLAGLCAQLTANCRSREVALPLLFFPFSVPLSIFLYSTLNMVIGNTSEVDFSLLGLSTVIVFSSSWLLADLFDFR